MSGDLSVRVAPRSATAGWAPAAEAARPARARLEDFFALTKPGITRLVVATSGTGFVMASTGPLDLVRLAHTLIGTALVAGGANALNQWWEQDVDACMRRTQSRPLPAGRLGGRAALLFALLIAAAGEAYLAALVNVPTALLTALSLASYVLCYTPLKKRTPLATLVGAVPGALPVMSGWTAAAGTLAPGAWVLFGILFFWQMPHFLSLAWMYREDYRRAGLVMLSVLDPDGRRTSRHALAYTVVLLAVSLALTPAGVTGVLYLAAAALLGLGFLLAARAMVSHPTTRDARRLFLASVVYLPSLLVFMLIDRALR